MGQYISRTAVCLNANAKSGNINTTTTQNTLKTATNVKQRLLKKFRKVKAPNQRDSAGLSNASSSELVAIATQSIPITNLQANRITTINVHIEDTGEVSATTTTKSAAQIETHCNAQCCQCSLNSARQLIIKIQLSKMEQSQLEEEQCSSQISQCMAKNANIQQTIAGNVVAENSDKLATGTQTCPSTSAKVVSPYIPKLLSQDCSKVQTCATAIQHSNELNKPQHKSNTTANIPLTTDDAQLNAVTLPKNVEFVNAASSSVNSSISATPQYRRPIVHSQVELVHCLVPDLDRITNASYYWGKMDRYEAERLLEGKEEGTFLLRDSAQEEFLFSVTFRKYGRSLHARIEQSGHKFSFDCHDPCVYTATTITGLLDHYKDPSCVMFFEPMLTIPLHRRRPFSLQQLSRAKIVSHTTYDGINQMELPARLKAYLKEFHYKQKLRILTLENGMYGSSWYYPEDT